MADQPTGDSTSSSNEVLDPRKVTLNDIVDTFLAAKRSLSSIELVARAREIVESGRVALEENATLAAINSFVKAAVEVQLDSLNGIRAGGKAVESEGYEELKDVVKALDEASARLNGTLDLLRSTRVEPSFRDASEDPKCLFDFVDEHGVQELYESIKQSMDRFDGYRQSLHDVFRSFENDLDSLMEALEPVLPGHDENAQKAKENSLLLDVSPVPSLFTSLENHATDVASHLESLVKHYDLCLSALRNTEGGGEFISKASQEDTPQLAGLGLGITNLEDDKPTETISEQDRLNILMIIMKDATEVDGVFDEIRDGLAEMEDHLSQIDAYVVALRATSQRLHSTYGLLRGAMEKVPDYINGCSEFQIAWEEEKRLLDTKMDEIEGLTEFYDEFSSGYDALIVEAHRRRFARKEMDKIAKQALSQIEKLYRAELKRRDEFRKSQGEYLPSDIWPGLMDEPIRFELAPVGDESQKIPELSRSVIEAAMERLSSRQNE